MSPRAPGRVCMADTECCDSVSLSYSVDASEVTDLHVISYEVERDLMPLILSNCQYQMEQGRETLQEFDLEKVERQVTSRFLQGKPRLTLKVRLAPWYLWCRHICFVKVGLSVAFLQRFPSELGVGMTTQLRFPPETGTSLPAVPRPSTPLSCLRASFPPGSLQVPADLLSNFSTIVMALPPTPDGPSWLPCCLSSPHAACHPAPWVPHVAAADPAPAPSVRPRCDRCSSPTAPCLPCLQATL